ncbi:ubiquitin carboxyl-terminal hydrolase L5 [Rhodotorula toruloides]|uniref:Ubiquitin carboxyl-terminal hydrolase n=1 Tax=Rhodotorula toruloides TaxID=5286 RepID=A0A511KJC1_RHOTO|nr:ubiquitin carboxyl-terminal hydrolase L5 [Rhodotorula toruloides]
MAESAGWSLTESDPGVFTGLLHELGVRGLEVEELWGLDAQLLQDLQPVFALVFLFKWVGNGDPEEMDGKMEEPAGPHYFAHQVINNACASIALLNATLNIRDPDVQLGEELSNLQLFSEELDPETRGWTISNSEKIREVHNSFARSDPFHLEENRPQDEHDDAYHFIAYLPIGDKLYELDGLKPMPVSHGEIPGGRDKWTDMARAVLERRIATYPAGEVMFNLLAVTGRRTALQKRLAELEAVDQSSGDVQAQLVDVRDKLQTIEERLKDWEVENALRRHNYIGLVHALLVESAKQDKLRPQIEEAKQKMKQKIEEKRRKGEMMDEDD